MKALSLRQPWAAAVLGLGKCIENRRWRTKFRGEFLIHAAKGMTADEWEGARDFCEDVLGVSRCFEIAAALGDDPADARHHLCFGGIVGIARLVDVVPPRPEYMPGGLEVHYPETLRESGWRWHMRNQFGFVLEDVRPTTFVPLRGELQFFDVPDDVAALARGSAASVIANGLIA